jgi:hypothetical protein
MVASLVIGVQQVRPRGGVVAQLVLRRRSGVGWVRRGSEVPGIRGHIALIGGEDVSCVIELTLRLRERGPGAVERFVRRGLGCSDAGTLRGDGGQGELLVGEPELAFTQLQVALAQLQVPTTELLLTAGRFPQRCRREPWTRPP